MDIDNSFILGMLHMVTLALKHIKRRTEAGSELREKVSSIICAVEQLEEDIQEVVDEG